MSDVKIPDGWHLTCLDNVARWGSGGTPSRKVKAYYEGDIPWVKTGDLGNKYLKASTEFITDEAIKKSSAKLFKKGSVAIAMYGATIGKTSILEIDCTTNQACAVGEPNQATDTEFLYYLLINEKSNFIDKGKGGAQPNISQTIIKAHSIVLPPLAEQNEIARLLDQHLAQVEQIKAHLAAIPKLITTFRQSVLADAVSGKLTTDWRCNNDINQWRSSPLKDVCLKVQSGSTPKNKPFDQGGTIPFLKVYNIVDQKVDFGYKPQFITSEVHKQKSKRSITLPNDVLMNIVGPPLCKVAIVTDEYPEWNLNQAITLFRADPKKLDYRFLYYFLREGRLVRDVTHDLKGSVGQVNISLTQCRESTINYPSLLEQNEIVSRVEELFAFADNIERQVQSATEHVNLLTQSILAKAFRGELTADWRKQNPELISDDNSAEALLARIQAQMKVDKAKKKTNS